MKIYKKMVNKLFKKACLTKTKARIGKTLYVHESVFMLYFKTYKFIKAIYMHVLLILLLCLQYFKTDQKCESCIEENFVTSNK